MKFPVTTAEWTLYVKFAIARAVAVKPPTVLTPTQWATVTVGGAK